MAQKLNPNDYLQGLIEGSIEVEDGSGMKYEYKVAKLESEMIPEEEAMLEQDSTGFFLMRLRHMPCSSTILEQSKFFWTWVKKQTSLLISEINILKGIHGSFYYRSSFVKIKIEHDSRK